jgi:hypothetical protein
VSRLRRACLASWAVAKREADSLGYVTLNPASATGWMLELAKDLRVEDAETLVFAEGDWWNHVRDHLRAIRREEVTGVPTFPKGVP